MLVSITGENPLHIAVMLVNLHPQLENDDLIVVKSINQEVAKIVKTYSSSRCVTIFDNQADVERLCKIHNMDGVLFLSGGVVFSMTYIQNLKRAIRMSLYDAIVPKKGIQYQTMNPNFVYYNKSTQKEDIQNVGMKYLSLPFVRRGKIGNIKTIGLLTNELVYETN